MITSGEVTSTVTIIGVVFSALHVTGIDAGTINNGINGLVDFVTFIAAVWTWYKHNESVKQNQALTQ